MPQKQKILIVDDEKILLDVLGKKLSQAGYEVVTAMDGEEGVSKIRAEKFDLIMLDILMPKMGGFEVMEQMKKEGILDSQPVIVISNSGSQEDLARASEMGAKDVIVKVEFDPNEILEKVKKILEEK